MFRMFQSLVLMVATTSFVFSLVAIGGRRVQAESIQSGSIDTVGSARTDYGKMPLLFEMNKGQTDKHAKFVSRSTGYTLYLANNEAVFSLKVPGQGSEVENQPDNPKTAKREKTRSDVLKMQFVGANANPTVEGETEAVTKTNYYIGKKRFENLPNYSRVNYKNLYSGVDAVFYGNENNQLEYDFTLAPNADSNQIRLNFDGAENISVDANGNLIVKTANTELVQQKPFAYQEIDGHKREVASRYVVSEDSVEFEIGEYDKSKELVIDPALLYSTYLGGTAFDSVNDIAADAQGNAYVVGETSSLNFHGETRASNDGIGVFVGKIDPTGSQLLYATILDGNSDDQGKAITIDASSNVYVVGQSSNNFPTTSGAFDTNVTAGSGDAFAAKLDTNGNLVYSTNIGGIGGAEVGSDVAVDAAGKAYVVGVTNSGITFPQKNRFQGCGVAVTTNSLDAFLTVLNATATDVTYSTCFGGGGFAVGFDDSADSIALDSANNAYITGNTNANNFPTKNAFQSTIGGGIDAFVVKFNPAASGDASLMFSTFLGGGGTERGFGIAVSPTGSIFVTGVTGSFDFPLKNPIDSTNQINEAFITQFSSTGSLTNSTFLGGADQDQCDNIVVGAGDNIYVIGQTRSTDFPLLLAFQTTHQGGRDVFVTKLRFGVGIISSTYFGGTGNDRGFGIALNGSSILIGGNTESNNLTTTAVAPNVPFKATSNASVANADGFLAKIIDTAVDSVGIFRPATTFLLTQSTTDLVSQTATLTFLLAGQKGVAGDWNGDDIDTIGSFTDGVWKIRNSNFQPISALSVTTVNFGLAGDLPVVGDWNGDGVDTVGTYRPSTGEFFLTNSTNAAAVDFTIRFGVAEDLPIAGDWNGDGIDTVGVFRPSVGQFFLTNANIANPPIDLVAFFGTNGDLPIGGDFDGNGIDTVGVWRPSTIEFFLSNDNINIARQFAFGAVTDQPIVGDWDGKPNP